jgi:hypothetical protein
VSPLRSTPAWLATVLCALATPSAAAADAVDLSSAFTSQNWSAIAIGIAVGLALGELARIGARLFRFAWLVLYVWGRRVTRWAVVTGAVVAAVYVLR